MSRRVKPSVDPLRQARAAGEHDRRLRHARRGCGDGPAAVANPTILFRNDDGHDRHQRIHVFIRCDEQSGAKEYIANLRISTDGGTTYKDPYRRRTVKAKDDAAGTTIELDMGYVRKGTKVSFRIRSADECKGTWGPGGHPTDGGAGWSANADPTDAAVPPGVTGGTLDVDVKRTHIRWTLPVDPLNTDVPDPRVAYVWVELWRDALDTGTLIARDKYCHGEHRSFRNPKPGSNVYWARVYTVSASGVKSAAASTSATKQTPSQPAAPSVAFEDTGKKHNRYKAVVTVATVADTDHAIDHYKVQFVHKATSATPTSATNRDGKIVDAQGTSAELTLGFRNIPRDHYCFARSRAIDDDGNKSAWSSWSTAAQPSGATGPSAPGAVTATAEKHHILFTWADVADDRLTEYQVTMKRGAVVVSGYPIVTRKTQHRFHVPKEDRNKSGGTLPGVTYNCEVRSADELGNLSAASTGTRSANGMVVLEADEDLDVVGQTNHLLGDLNLHGNLTLVDDGGAIRTGTSGSYISIKRVGNSSDKIRFVTAGGTTDLIATAGGVQIGGAASEEIGFWGASPVARPAAVANLTDSTGGATNGDVEDVSAVSAGVNRNFAELTTKLNEVIDKLQTIGILG